MGPAKVANSHENFSTASKPHSSQRNSANTYGGDCTNLCVLNFMPNRCMGFPSVARWAVTNMRFVRRGATWSERVISSGALLKSVGPRNDPCCEATPINESRRKLAAFKPLIVRHEFLPQDVQGPSAHPKSRRDQIMFQDLQTHSFAEGCSRCILYKQGTHDRARFHIHNGCCLGGVYNAIMESGAGEMQNIDASTIKIAASTALPASPPPPSSSHALAALETRLDDHSDDALDA